MPRPAPLSAVPASPFLLGLLLCAALSACSDLPRFDTAVPPSDGPAPSLVPVAEILARADQLGKGSTKVDPLAQRAAGLRNRAANLRDQ